MISATGLTWRQGQEECEKLGGYLAEIKSEMQQAFLVSFKITYQQAEVFKAPTLRLSSERERELLET